MIRRTLKFYPNIAASDVRTVLIQRGDRILPELPERLGEYAKKALTRRNVEVICDASITSATGSAVYLDTGITIHCALLITTVGNGPHPFTEALGVNLERGKLPVDNHLRVKGPDNVWALGDAALIPLGNGSEFAPPTAQFATRRSAVPRKKHSCNAKRKTAGRFPFQAEGFAGVDRQLPGRGGGGSASGSPA